MFEIFVSHTMQKPCKASEAGVKMYQTFATLAFGRENVSNLDLPGVAFFDLSKPRISKHLQVSS